MGKTRTGEASARLLPLTSDDATSKPLVTPIAVPLPLAGSTQGDDGTAGGRRTGGVKELPALGPSAVEHWLHELLRPVAKQLAGEDSWLVKQLQHWLSAKQLILSRGETAQVSERHP